MMLGRRLAGRSSIKNGGISPSHHAVRISQHSYEETVRDAAATFGRETEQSLLLTYAINCRGCHVYEAIR